MTTKINKLLKIWPKGTIATSRWMEEQGIRFDLRKQYKDSGWIKAIANGAYARFDDQPDWKGALFALQNGKLEPGFHAGAMTAIELKGRAHFISPTGDQPINLFTTRKATIPRWLHAIEESKRLKLYKTDIFVGAEQFTLPRFQCGEFYIHISSLERAIMELLYLVPNVYSVNYARTIIESLTTLRPRVLQHLLEVCRSIKVKRLLLFLADEAQHRWVSDINVDAVNLGAGKRTIDKGGVYSPKYQITVQPREEN
jgi:hypothetical protein